jgi:hypothetical protein
MQQANLSNQFGRYKDVATIGANAAAGLGTQGTTAASNEGKYINAAGLDTQAGLTNATNALSGGANNYLAYKAYQDRTAGLSGYQNRGPSGQNYGEAA